jgi:hypothetical protein
VIAGAPASITYGQTFAVRTPDASTLDKVTFIRLGSATHAFNQSQLMNSLTFKREADHVEVTAPANANLATPGYYMLFLVDVSGVPSVAAMVQIE